MVAYLLAMPRLAPGLSLAGSRAVRHSRRRRQRRATILPAKGGPYWRRLLPGEPSKLSPRLRPRLGKGAGGARQAAGRASACWVGRSCPRAVTGKLLRLNALRLK